MSNVCLAMTWVPRGEQERLRRFYPTLQTIYTSVVVAVPPDADPKALEVLKSLPNLVLVNRNWGSGRHIVIEAGLQTSADAIHYVDADRLIRWVETRPDELRRTVESVEMSECLVIGRTETAFKTHPLAQQQTERMSNVVCSHLLGRSLDFSAGSKGFSRAAVEFLLRNSPPASVMGTDSEWIILLQRGGFRVEPIEVDGLDWETADRYLDHAADAETQKRLVAEFDADPKNWAARIQTAQEIIDAGFEALTRPLKEAT